MAVVKHNYSNYEHNIIYKLPTVDDQYFISYEESSVWQKTVDRGELCKLSDHGLELALRDAHTITEEQLLEEGRKKYCIHGHH